MFTCCTTAAGAGCGASGSRLEEAEELEEECAGDDMAARRAEKRESGS
jgi:hypothetical protein